MNHEYSKCSPVRLHTSQLLNMVLGGLGGSTTCCGSNLSLVRIVTVSRKIKWPYCTCGERRDAYWVLVGTSKVTRPVGTSRRRWDDNTSMDLKYKGAEEDGDWIDVTGVSDKWRSAVKVWMKLRVL